MNGTTESEVVERDGPVGTAYVIKSFSATRRALKAAIVLLSAFWLALYGWKNQIERGTLLAEGWVPLAILAAAVFWSTRIWRRKEVKVLASVTQPISAINPTKKVLIVTVLLVAAIGLIWYMQWNAGQFAEYWWFAWPLAVLYVGYLVILFMPQHRRILTPAAKEEYARLKLAEEQKKNEPAQPMWLDELAEKLWAKWWVRYGIGMLMLWAAWEFAQSDHKNGWLGAIAMTVIALVCMIELFGWLVVAAIGGGILWALFGAIAALPVSVAVIIGAFIIASAMKK